MGKTSSTLAAISFLKSRKLLDKVLIIAPLNPCYLVWPAEIEKWKDFGHLTYEILHGPDKESALKRKADIYLINHEGLDWLLDTSKGKTTTGKLRVGVDLRKFKSLGFDTLVLDELSKFKHHTTGRFKAMKQVLHTFGRRWGLTGSPAANHLLDLFGECYMLDMGNALGPFVSHFRNEFWIPDHMGWNWTLKPNAQEGIYERISPLVLQLDYDQLDMPELIENNILVRLPHNVKETYDAVEKDFIARLDEGGVTALTAAAASTKLRQIANGGVYLDADVDSSGLRLPGKRKWKNLHTEKVDALRDLVDELQGDPLLVAYDFEHDLDRLRMAFKDAVFACDFTPKQFRDIERRWNAGEIPLLFGHPQSLAHGLNLQGACSNVCWHSLTWNREHYDQFLARVWRSGNSKKRVIVHHIIAEGTIDEVLLGATKYKGSVEQALFDGLKKLRERRSA